MSKTKTDVIREFSSRIGLLPPLGEDALASQQAAFAGLASLVEELEEPLYIVGSGVRERLLGKPLRNLYLVSGQDPARLARLFAKRYPGSDLTQHGSARFQVCRDQCLVVVFGKIQGQDIQEHLGKLFYTADAVAMKVNDFMDWQARAQAIDGRLLDPFGGAADLGNRQLRLVPGARMEKEPMNYLRGIRLMAENGLDIDPQTEQTLKDNVEVLRNIQGPEYKKELFRILEMPDSAWFMNLMDRHIGMLAYIFPEVEPMKRVGECKYHVVDTLTHSIYTLRVLEGVVNAQDFFERHLRKAYQQHMRAKTPGGSLRLSLVKLGALFHDVGKPSARFIDSTGRTRFAKHEVLGAALLEEIARRLCLDPKDARILSRYSLLHMYPLNIYKNNDMSGETLYAMFCQTGEETLDIVLIGYADIVSTRRLLDPEEEMGNFKVHVEYIANSYITRYRPLKKLPGLITPEQINEVIGCQDGQRRFEELRKDIFMGRVDLEAQAIGRWLQAQKQHVRDAALQKQGDFPTQLGLQVPATQKRSNKKSG